MRNGSCVAGRKRSRAINAIKCGRRVSPLLEAQLDSLQEEGGRRKEQVSIRQKKNAQA
jgi:hypothetical protein